MQRRPRAVRRNRDPPTGGSARCRNRRESAVPPGEPMTPVSDPRELLASLAPSMAEGEFVFCSVPHPGRPPSGVEVLATMREAEGLSLVLARQDAERAGLAFEGPFRLIRLGVSSSLDAVGLTAAVSRALAAAGISANVIAAYHHDYILVPATRADEALAALEQLA